MKMTTATASSAWSDPPLSIRAPDNASAGESDIAHAPLLHKRADLGGAKSQVCEIESNLPLSRSRYQQPVLQMLRCVRHDLLRLPGQGLLNWRQIIIEVRAGPAIWQSSTS
jgi:hypothetical protein